MALRVPGGQVLLAVAPLSLPLLRPTGMTNSDATLPCHPITPPAVPFPILLLPRHRPAMGEWTILSYKTN